ncbi:MAG: hypothetical protein GY896_16980 [Gammaproteobacteria bacterium]|nr:hypothetical protein [Gammaproteobacteria bacterium]
MKFTKPLLITKLKATAVHMSLSFAVFAYLVYQIYFNWYPQPYFSVDGGWQGIRLVAAVDLVLGPLITFLIFDLSKKRREIVFDLATILVIQFGALAYGVYVTYSQRPVAIVVIDEFVVSTIMEYYGDKLSSEDELKKYSDEKPPIIYAHVEQSQEAIDEITRIKVEEKILEHAQLGLYRPKSEFRAALQKMQLVAFDRMEHYQAIDRFEEWLRKNQKSREQVLVARFTGRYGAVWLVFDEEGHYLSYF